MEFKTFEKMQSANIKFIAKAKKDELLMSWKQEEKTTRLTRKRNSWP